MPQIADTGFLVAFWIKEDLHHQWARNLAVRAPLLTCAPVLTEAAYLPGDPAPLLQMLWDGDLSADFDLTQNAGRLMRWLAKFADLDPGLADACIVAIAETTPRSEILTTDRRDFTAYRTLSGKPLRCVFPSVR
jgi:predicted nucleic acid-binding protein